MAYSHVMFDLGGVVVEVESDRLVYQLAALLGRSFEEVQEIVYHQELLLPFELGRITPRAYYDGLQGKLQLPWSYEQFVRAWNGIFNENREVANLLERLHVRHQLLVLSNTNTLHLAHIRAMIPSASFFHEWIASCDVGLRKPDPEIYRLALQRAGARAGATVYIDDRPELVEAGRSAGLTALRFENGRRLEEDLRALGFNI